MATRLPENVLVVYFHLLDWEEANQEDLFTSFFDLEDTIFMLMGVAKALKHNSPPDIILDGDGYAEFVLNEFVEYAADTGVNNIKSIIKTQDRRDIGDAAAITFLEDPSTWRVEFLADAFEKINLLLDPPIGPALN